MKWLTSGTVCTFRFCILSRIPYWEIIFFCQSIYEFSVFLNKLQFCVSFTLWINLVTYRNLAFGMLFYFILFVLKYTCLLIYAVTRFSICFSIQHCALPFLCIIWLSSLYITLSPPWYFENRIPLKLVLGGVCRLANYIVAYEETQLNRVSDFRDFVCSLFPKAIRFDFYLL